MRRKPVGSLLLAAGCITLIAFLFKALSPDEGEMGSSGFYDRADSYSVTPSGFKAFWELLNRLEIPVGRFEKTPSFLNTDPKTDPQHSLLILFNPSSEIWNRERNYIEDLKGWVARGGVLLFAGDRWTLLDSFIRSDEDWKMEEISSGEKTPGVEGDELAYWVETYGLGRVVEVNSANPFQNQNIGKGENAWFLYQLVRSFGERRILIDEFYHGIVSAPSLSELAFQKPWGYATFSLFLFLLFFVLSKIFHFGPVLEERPPARSRAEFLEAMARLYQKGGDYPFILKKVKIGYLKEMGNIDDPRWEKKIESVLHQEKKILEGGISRKDLFRWTDLCHRLYEEVRHERGAGALSANRQGRGRYRFGIG